MSDMDQYLAENEAEEVTAPETPDPQEAEAEQPEAPAEPEPTPEPQREHETVPLATFLDLKAELKAMRQQMQQRPQPQPAPIPDVFEDQQGFTNHIQSTVSQAVMNERMNMSEALARDKYGDETVDAAFQALQASGDTAAIQAVQRASMPYQALVKWHKQQQVVREVGDDPDGWRAKEREKMRQELMAEMAAKQVKEAAARPAPSMANVTGTGGTQSPGWSGPVDLDDLL